VIALAYPSFFLEILSFKENECMDKVIIPDEEGEPQAPDIEFWEDDCGLADLAKDAFANLKKTLISQTDEENTDG
jgi:hypothetical protein